MPTSITPRRDASEMFPDIRNLIRDANGYVHLATWGLDDEVRLAGDTQETSLHSRTRRLHLHVRGDDVENLHCNEGALANLPPDPGGPCIDPNSLIFALRAKCAELAYRAETAISPTPTPLANRARGEVMVLVWHMTTDDVWSITLTALDDLSYLWVPYHELIGWNPTQLRDHMRQRGSGESLETLLAFQQAYIALGQPSTFVTETSTHHGTTTTTKIYRVPMPTGVFVMTQLNKNFKQANLVYTSSHHQKLVTTDQGAYVGGLNFFKEYWDNHDHDYVDINYKNQPKRFSSGSLKDNAWKKAFETLYVGDQPTSDRPPIAGPLHDTGTIIRGDAVDSVNRLFAERWSTNIHHWEGVDNTGEGKSSYGRLKAKIKKAYTHSSNQRTALLGLLGALEASHACKVPSQTPAPGTAVVPADVVTKVTFAVSDPDHSYDGSGGRQGIRKAYEDAIANHPTTGGVVSYFENQYFEDHDFFLRLWEAMPAKVARRNIPANPGYQATNNYEPGAEPNWARPDAHVIAVLPYSPAGMIGYVDADLRLIIEGTVQREMQNLMWLQIKTAGAVYLRSDPTKLFRTFRSPAPPPTCPNGPADLPYIEFEDRDVDADPQNLTLDSWVLMYGDTDPTAPCPKLQTARQQVRDILPVGAFESFCLVNSGQTARGPGAGPPAGDEDVYHDFMKNHAIYIHSKHSAFMGQNNVYVFGSANINPRSLGVNRNNNPPRKNEAEDSECAVFLQPPNPTFWCELWKEHLGQAVSAATPATLDAAAVAWKGIGFDNLNLIRQGGWPAKVQRVVSLDPVLRAIKHGVTK